MNITSVTLDDIEYPIETKLVEENGYTHIRFICKFPNGTEKYFRAKYNVATKQNLSDDREIMIDERLESMILWELRKELFQEIYNVKIVDMWERFAKLSLIADELRNAMDEDHGFKKFVEEFYPEYVKV
jgi:hypothetical protein